MTELAHRTMVALTPQDVPTAQAEIATWCRAKILELAGELREARHNLRQAKTLMLGSPKAWQNVVRKTIGRMIYYAKIQMAVKAGYLIVPNFPAEMIAVRVKRDAPPGVTMDAWPNQINKAKPELNLPPGVGRYVDETNPHTDLSYDFKAADGKFVHKRQTRVDSYDEVVDFPLALVKPEILAATEHAMSLKLFDRIGVAHGANTTSLKQRRSDPIVVGHIIDGTESARWGGEYPHYCTFFIAWWLDTKAL